MGPLVHMNVIGQNWLIVSDISLINQIMRDRDNFPNPTIFRDALIHRMGRSMFATEGIIWKEKHDIMQPLMNQKMMERSVQVIQKKMFSIFRSNRKRLII